MEKNLPMMEVNVNGQLKSDKEIITDEQMIGLYGEILGLIREDRKEVGEILTNFLNMVLNEGDASTSSKEALVNLLKIKSETTNNMSKVMDLLVRIKMKDRTLPPISVNQTNQIEDGNQRRKLLKAIQKEIDKVEKVKKEDNAN